MHEKGDKKMAAKPLCIISTVGSSLFTNKDNLWLRSQYDAFMRLSEDDRPSLSDICNKDWRADQTAAGQLYQAGIKGLRERDSEELRKVSAELNVIDRLLPDRGRDVNTQLHFLCTETSEGVMAGRILRDFCHEFFGGQKGTISIIEGLQVKDGKRFRRVGLPTLLSKIYNLLDKAPSGTYERIFNVTGGFKAVVPYLTIVGMLEDDVQLDYMYEQSPDLIQLKPIGVRFDYKAFEQYYDALNRLCNDDDLTPGEELRQILGVASIEEIDDLPIWSLLDWFEDNGERHYQINGMGLIVHRYLEERRNRATIYLSRQADEAYKHLSPTEQQRWKKILSDLRNEGIRENRKHASLGDIKVSKKRGTAERPIYKMDGDNVVLVLELTSHRDRSYDSALERVQRNIAQYQRYRLWEEE
jgi:putative CRISPR-associated protein (TIGR02619 family)